MTDLRQAAEMALEALESVYGKGKRCEAAIEALRQALAQPEQEPVAMRYDFDGYGYQYIDSGSGSNWQTRIKDAEPLYAAPFTAPPSQRKTLAELLASTPVDEYQYEVVAEHADGTYTTKRIPKRQWVGLTADEIWKCNKAKSGSAVEFHICSAHQNVLDFAEAIEAKLKEKNT